MVRTLLLGVPEPDSVLGADRGVGDRPGAEFMLLRRGVARAAAVGVALEAEDGAGARPLR